MGLIVPQDFSGNYYNSWESVIKNSKSLSKIVSFIFEIKNKNLVFVSKNNNKVPRYFRKPFDDTFLNSRFL